MSPGRLFQVAFLALGLSFATASAIQAACSASWEGDGAPLIFRHGLSEAERRALSATVYLGLDDPGGVGVWPMAEIDVAPPCELARFEASGLTWVVSGGEAPAPLRWVRADGRDEVFFVAQAPALADAGRWSAAPTPWMSPTGEPVYLLVGASEHHHFVFKVYDGVPGLKRLSDDLVGVIDGSTTPLATLDRLGGAVSLFLETATGRAADIYRPGQLTRDRIATLYGPDGHYFAPLPGGGVSLSGSGLYCAARLGGFQRTRLLVVDLRPDSLDLGCSYETLGDDIVSVFSQRLADPASDKAYIAQQIASSEAQTRIARRIGRSHPTGSSGHQWVDASGVRQAIWFRRSGEFMIEVHATYSADASADVSDLAESLLSNRLRENMDAETPG
jgi:hypothetical protein